MPRRVQSFGEFEQQFCDIIENSLDKTIYGELTTHATPDAEFSFEHGLLYVPNGFLVFSNDKAGIVYKGTTAWTTSLIYLKCNVASCLIRISVF